GSTPGAAGDQRVKATLTLTARGCACTRAPSTMLMNRASRARMDLARGLLCAPLGRLFTGRGLVLRALDPVLEPLQALRGGLERVRRALEGVPAEAKAHVGPGKPKIDDRVGELRLRGLLGALRLLHDNVPLV